eukprot:13829950-Heterocapsa_arctica.AAC.1
MKWWETQHGVSVDICIKYFILPRLAVEAGLRNAAGGDCFNHLMIFRHRGPQEGAPSHIIVSYTDYASAQAAKDDLNQATL